MWTIDCVRMSLVYEPLLNCIFTLSLQGMRWIDRAPDIGAGDLVTQRARYLEATIEDYRNTVASLDTETADPVAMVCQLLAVDAFASLRDRNLTPYRPPMEWLHMCRGVRSVMATARALIWDNPQSKARRILEYGRAFYEDAMANASQNPPVFAYLVDTMDEETRSSPDGAAYENTVCYIGSIWLAQQKDEDITVTARRLIVFSILIDPLLAELIDAKDPRALVIMAHFFAAAAPSQQLWWIGNNPSREILAINSHLGSEWKREMRWPVQIAQKWQ